METDNFNNSLIEIRDNQRMLRSSKSRSMTPGPRSTSNNEDSSTVKNESSSVRHSTGRKVVTSSSKSVSRRKTVGGKSSVTVLVEERSSQENSKTLPPSDDISPRDEPPSRLSVGANVDIMELRSERQKISSRQSNANNRAVANGTGGDAATTTKTNTSTRRSHNRVRSNARIRTSDYSSDEEDAEDGNLPSRDAQSQRVLSVYRGDYWNKFPKTDFTYSPVSKDHYKEVAPGVSVKPNMSRGTYQHASSASATYYATSPAGETRSATTETTATTSTVRRSRFFDAGKAGTKVPAYIRDYAAVDSDEDEVDARVRSEVAASVAQSRSLVTYFTSFFTTVWTIVTTTCTTTVERVTGRPRGDQGAQAGFSTPPRQTSRGWWARMLDYVYFLPAYVSAVDLGILAPSAGSLSSLADHEQERPKRLRLFSALMLLLLLLLCGWWLLYYLGLEDTVADSSVLLGDTWAAARGWAGMFGDWCATFGRWILLPFAAKQMQQREEWRMSTDYAVVPPSTVATTPLSSTPPTLPAVDSLVEALLASDRFQLLLASRQGDPVGEVLASPRFLEWVSSRVDVEALALQVVASRQVRGATDVGSLAAGVWETGRLQAHLDERLAGSADGLRRELDQKSHSFELHNAQLAGEMDRMKEEIELKLNASVTEMKEKLKEQLVHNEELRRAHEEEIRLLKVQLERCCDKTPAVIPWQDIESYVLRHLAGIYGVANPDKVERAELRALVGSMFVGRRQFEAALENVTAHHRAEMREVSEQSAQSVMDAISERISNEFASQQHLHMVGGGGGGLTDAGVMEIVNRAIMTYDADKTGMVDYALESSGGSIISTRCTESYYKHSASMTLFGIPYWYPVNTPRTVIQPGVHPGECWAFQGSHGFMVVELAGLVRISSFSVEHIPRSLAFNGNIDSAPKDFSVWGLVSENDVEPMELGKYTYLKNGTSLQYFLVARTDVQPFKIIELRIHSNHGNLEYTCLYRFRVHGTWVSY